MSSRIIRTFSKRTGKTVQELEIQWEKSKLFLQESGLTKDNPIFYESLIRDFKIRIGMQPENHILEKFSRFLKD